MNKLLVDGEGSDALTLRPPPGEQPSSSSDDEYVRRWLMGEPVTAKASYENTDAIALLREDDDDASE